MQECGPPDRNPSVSAGSLLEEIQMKYSRDFGRQDKSTKTLPETIPVTAEFEGQLLRQELS